jgi:NitT/TauT family transport system ATP-binding protein
MSLHLRITGKSADRPVLGHIDLTLRMGQVTAVLGPSGCGKTTLLRIAAGLDTAFQGTRSWQGATPPRIGTVFQEPRLLPWRTVRQNVLLAQDVANPGLADDMLRRLDLEPFQDTWPGALSLGMARRVAIARALAIQPDVLLLDEALVSLDPAMARRVQDLLRAAWRDRPIATLMVTHDRAEAEALADRIVVLGGTPTEITAETVMPPRG